MFPLPDTALSISKIAEHWSRELPGTPPAGDLLKRLLAAFWAGQLGATLPGTYADESRHKLLRAIRRAAPLPGIRVAPSAADFPPSMIDEPDGGVVVDMMKRVVLPAGEAEIDEATATAAFEELAKAEMVDYGATVAPILLALSVERDELARYCDAHGFGLPQFWFQRASFPARAAAEAHCRRWLGKRCSASATPVPKADVRKEALGLFPGLSSRSFDRAWAETAPETWKAAGRRPSRR